MTPPLLGIPVAALSALSSRDFFRGKTLNAGNGDHCARFRVR
jgi:hypothetical protein